MVGVGILWAVASAFCNGSFGIATKLPKVQEADVSPIILNFWASMGIVLSSLPLLAIPGVEFTAIGMVSGALFVLSTVHAYAAIRLLGISVASGIWCGTAVLVSYVYGVRFAGDTITRPGLAAGALVLLLAGIAGIAINGQLASHRARKAADALEQDDEAGLLDSKSQERPLKQRSVLKTYLLGGLCALVTGVFGGLILAPMSGAPEHLRNLRYVPSMAAGVAIAAFVQTPLMVLLMGKPYARMSWRVGAPYGMVSGAVWNIGNIASIIAVTDPAIGLAVAYPIMQCGLLVAGTWGIFLFGELRGVREQLGYWVSGALLIVGATLLSASK